MVKNPSKWPWMTYSLEFHPKALEEWGKLPEVVKKRFKEKLGERLKNPHVPKSRLSGGYNLYKIKMNVPPFRLTYQVKDSELIIIALSVGKRDGNVYKNMINRSDG